MSQVILQKVNHNYMITIYKIMEYKYIVYENNNQNFKNNPAEFNIHATVQSIELLEQ